MTGFMFVSKDFRIVHITDAANKTIVIATVKMLQG